VETIETFFKEFENYELFFYHYGEKKQTTIEELYQMFRLRLLKEITTNHG
jgi:hypothetical protein